MDCIGLLKTVDILDAVRLIGTHGPTTSNDDVVTWLENFMKTHTLRLYSIGVHWLDGNFEPEVVDAMAFTREIEQICPDMIEGNRNARKAVANDVKLMPFRLDLRWQ